MHVCYTAIKLSEKERKCTNRSHLTEEIQGNDKKEEIHERLEKIPVKRLYDIMGSQSIQTNLLGKVLCKKYLTSRV